MRALPRIAFSLVPRRNSPSAGRGGPPVSAATLERAQEADSCLTPENWAYGRPEFETPRPYPAGLPAPKQT